MIFFIAIFTQSIRVAISNGLEVTLLEFAPSLPTPDTLYVRKIDAKLSESTGGRGRRGAWGAQGKRGPMAHNPAYY